MGLPADNADGLQTVAPQVTFPCHPRMVGDDYYMTNPRHAAGDADATDSGELAWEPRRWYLTVGGALATVYAKSDGEHEYRSAGCGEASESPGGRKMVQANANDHAANCHAAPDPRPQRASEIARDIITDVSAELPRIDAKAAAGIALAVALIVGLVSTQTPSASPSFVAGIVGGVFLTLALLLFLAALAERDSAAHGSVLRWARYESGHALLADLAQLDKAVYYATVAVALSGAAHAKSRRLQLGIYAGAFAIMSFVCGVGIAFLGG